MTLPVSLPTWVPWWVAFAVLVPVILYLLAFLIMPFNVLGVKGRLDGIEARLDEVQAEIRRLALRLPGLVGNDIYDEEPLALPEPSDPPMVKTRGPPIPPASPVPGDGVEIPSPRHSPRRGEPLLRPTRSRAEPRLDWPR
ncbi:MAG: hypothetical protein ACREFJ_13090 [Acetobacteraceae bacterium]